VLPVVLIGGGGVRSQGAGKSALIVALLGVLALAAGILYLIPTGES
jgi:hypothetical protein